MMASPGLEPISLSQTGKNLSAEISLPSMQSTLPENPHAGFSGPAMASMSSVWNRSSQDGLSGLHIKPTQHVQHLAAPDLSAQEDLVPVQPATAQDVPGQKTIAAPAPSIQLSTAQDLPGQKTIATPAPSIQLSTAQDLPAQKMMPTPAPLIQPVTVQNFLGQQMIPAPAPPVQLVTGQDFSGLAPAPPVQVATPHDPPAGMNIAPAPTLTIQPAAAVSMQGGTMAAGQPNTASMPEKRSRKPPVARGEIVPLTAKDTTTTTTTTPPEWFTAAQTYLNDLDIKEWKECLVSWINLEEAIGLSEVCSVC